MGIFQTVKNLTSDDLEIPLMVVQPRVTGLKKTRLVHLSDLFEGRGEKGQCDLVRVDCLKMIGLMLIMLMSFSRVVSVVLVL